MVEFKEWDKKDVEREREERKKKIRRTPRATVLPVAVNFSS